MTAKRVPSKIVIAGNSKMSLNDRFSTIPKPRPRGAILKAQHKFPAKTRGVYPSQQKVVYEYIDSPPNEQDFQYEQPRPVVRRPRPAFQHRAVPFQSRVTFVNAPPVQRFQQQRNNFVQRGHQFQNGFKKPFRPNFNQHHSQNRQKIFNNQNRFHNNNRGGGSFQQRQAFNTVPKKKSLADLDRELDDYMRKPKHTPIAF